MKGLKSYIISMVFIFMAVSLLGCGEVEDKHIIISPPELSKVTIMVDDYAWNHVEFANLKLGINLVGSVSGSTHYLKDLVLLESSLDPNFSDPDLYKKDEIIRPYRYTVLVYLLNGENRIIPSLAGYAFDPPSAIVDTADMAKSSAVVFHASRCRGAFAIDPNIDLDNDEFATSPVLDEEMDRIYIGTKNGKLYAIDSNMDEVWAKDLASITSNPVVGHEGTIYLGTDDGLKAIDPNGEVRWTYSPASGPCATPAIDPDGFIYFGSRGGGENKIYCLDPNMNLQWYQETGPVFSPPAISLDETLYLADGYEKLYAFDLHGFSKWEPKLVPGVISSPAIDANDVLYIRDRSNNLYAYYAEDTNNPKIWEPASDLDPNSDPSDLDPDSLSSPVVGEDGRIYLVFSNKNADECYLYAFDPNLECSRLATLTGALSSSPVIGSKDPTNNVTNDFTIYVSTTYYDEDHIRTVTLYALDPNGTLKWNPPYIIKDDEPSDQEMSWPQELLLGQGQDETVYMVDRNKVYACVCPDNKLVEKGWPMVGKDTTHTSSKPDDRKPSMVKLLGVDYDPNTYMVEFTWKNPDVSDFAGAVIIRDPNSYITVYDGRIKIYESTSVSRGATESIPVDAPDLESYYYTIFTRDTKGNYSEGVTVGGLASSAWPCKGHDARRTGLSPYARQQYNTQGWSFQADSAIESSPAIGADGTIYFGCNDGRIYALDPNSTNPNGPMKWSYQTDGPVISSPAIDPNGVIYIGSKDKKMYALDSNIMDPNNILKWSYETDGEITSSPAIGSDGTVYVGSLDNYVYAINPDTTLEKWSYETDGEITSSPAIGSDGTIYIGSKDSYLYALDPSGGLKWKYKTGGAVESSPVIGIDGTIYFGSKDYYLYALNPNGSLKWKYRTNDSISTSSPAIGTDGTIYIGSTDNFVYALNFNGSLKWKYETGNFVYSSPAISSDGKIYIGSNDGDFYALDWDGQPVGYFSTGAWVYSSPVIGIDGTIYIGSTDNLIYALDPNGLDNP